MLDLKVFICSCDNFTFSPGQETLKRIVCRNVKVDIRLNGKLIPSMLKTLTVFTGCATDLTVHLELNVFIVMIGSRPFAMLGIE